MPYPSMLNTRLNCRPWALSESAISRLRGLTRATSTGFTLNPAEKCLAIVTPTSVGGRRRPHLEFYSHFQDKGTFSTDQALTPNFLAMPEERELRRLPANLEPETIWKIHKASIEQIKASGRLLAALEKESIYKQIERDQQELIDYQIQSGLLVRDEDETQLRPTWKFAFYFLFKILDPIPFGITLFRVFGGIPGPGCDPVRVLLACQRE